MSIKSILIVSVVLAISAVFFIYNQTNTSVIRDLAPVYEDVNVTYQTNDQIRL